MVDLHLLRDAVVIFGCSSQRMESELRTTRYSSRYVAHANVKMQIHHENVNKNVHYIRIYPKKSVK